MAKEYVEQVYINHSEKLYDIRDAEAEHVDSRVNTIRQAPDNEHYPTEKAVSDALAPKENLSNKTASWNTVPSDTRYPTEKLVRDTFDALESELEADNGKYALAQFEKLENKATAWSATPGDTKYPTEKLVVDTVNSIKTIVVDALPEITEALPGVNYVLRSGDGALLYKVIGNKWTLVGGSKVKVLAELPETGDSFTDFYIPNGTTGRYTHYRWLDEDGAFHAVGVDAYSKAEADLIFDTKENLENKVSAWGETTSDNHYPTEKLVKDTIEDLRDEAEHKSNKITAWSAEASDTKYPSEKLVKGALSDLSQDIESIDVITTHVVSELPAISEAIPDHDYVLLKGSGALHYKVINDEWKMVGGAMVRVVDTLPETGDSNTDYYMAADGADNVYLHYRWMDGSGASEGHYYAVGSDAYSKTEIDEMLSAITGDSTSSIKDLGDSILSLGNSIQQNTTRIEEVASSRMSYDANIVQEGDVYYLDLMRGEGESDPVTFHRLPLPATGGGGGQASTTTLVVDRVTPSPLIVTTTDKIIIEIDFSSHDSDNQEVDGNYVLKTGNTTIMSGSLVQGRNSFDVTEYCMIGTQKFNLTVTDEGGSSNMKTWTVQVVDVRIESTFSDRSTNAVGRAVNFTYTPYGAVSKTVHFKLDGTEIGTYQTSASGILQSYTIPAQLHGSHLLEVWATATINSKDIETEHLFRDIIWFDPELDAPVIGCIYRYDHYGVLKVKQYNTVTIPYVVYDPRTANPTVELRVDGQLVNELHLTSASNTWSYKSDVIDTHILTITCRTTTLTLRVEVTELGYDITPITANLAFDFNPSGMTNSSANRLWKDANNPEVALTVSDNFDWQNGGYQSDADGNQYFCVKTGTRAYISHNLFGINPKQDGAEFKVVFRTANVRDKDATFLTCLSTNDLDKAGLKMQAHRAYVYTSSDSLMTPYSEEDVIEFEYNINPINSEDESSTSFVMSYEDGVAARPLLYQNDAGYLLHQLFPAPITIGSDDCDVHIYRMKAYTSALSDSEILANFIADARDSDTMIARYERNQIYNENKDLTPESVAAACPDLKVIKIECPHFTNDKKDYVRGTNVQCIHKNGDPVYDNWTMKNMYHAGQGTTSNRYGLAGRNIDIIGGFDGENQVVSKIDLDPTYITELTLGDGTKYTGQDAKVSLTRTSVPNTWFNIKVNIASSENANNALLQKRYNDYLPYQTPGQKRDPRIKNSMEFVNCVIFLKESDPDLSTHREFDDTNWHFYSIGNIGDSKKTDNTRVNDPHDENEFVVEISDNTLPNSTFDTGLYYTATGGTTFDPNQAVLNEDLAIPSKSVYPISMSDWNRIDGYTQVTDPTFLVAENLGHMYERSGNTYTLTTDKAIDSSKTYYMVNYVNTKYKALYIDEYQFNVDTNEVDQVSGWDASFEFRYDASGTKDGESMSKAEVKELQKRLKQVFRNMYEFVITSSNADFVSHFGDWFITESFLYWYLFTERYTMIDNRSKNSFWHWGKVYITEAEAEEMGDDAENYTIDNAAAAVNNGYRFDLWDYDNDTALGIDNNGELNMTYGHEDVDYKTAGDPASGWIFNAADSVIWRRIRGLMNSQLRTMYQSRESLNCWSATSLITEFDAWQNQFPEELWRLDVERKYLRPYYVGNPVAGIAATSNFLKNMMNGRKRYQRRQFERNQEVYIGTKYFGMEQCADSRAVSFRCNTPQGAVVRPNYTLRIVPYSDMYLWVAYGNSAPQGRRAKAGVEETFTTSLTSMDDTQILIYCAENIQALNDLSACYIRANDFSYATRLKTLIIGSTVEGYSNPFITELSIGQNRLLETLDIRNCSNLTGTLNLSACTNLEKLYAEGTQITSVSFAPNGKISLAHLPASITSLTLRYLSYLSDFVIAGYDNLISLTSEYCAIDPYGMISQAIDTLQIVRALGISWTFADAAFLNRIYAMSDSLLSGSATITSSIRSTEIQRFNEKWKDLELITEGATVIYPYTVTYKNWNGDVLYTSYVDPNSYPNDPVADGLIDAPTRPADQQFTYTYAGWDGIDTRVNSNTEVTAKYSTAVRTYSVKWFAFDGDMSPLYTKNVQYGAEAVYEGSYPSEGDIDAGERHRIFVGWDKSTGCIKGDTNVIAKWEYAYASATGDLNTLSAAEIYAISAERPRNRFETKDYFDLPLGWDFDFDKTNVDSQLLLEERFFNGTSDYVDFDIELIKPGSPAFTLAIDYEFCADCDDKAILASCFNDGDNSGFLLLYNANSNDPGSATSAIRWTGSTSVSGYRVGKSSQRNIIVLRHQAGSSVLNVYSFNGATTQQNENVRIYDAAISMQQLQGTKSPTASSKLTFGAVRSDSGNRHSNNAKGWIHWAKVWHDDLGNDACRKLASWPHETLRMELGGYGRQQLAESNTTNAYASFFSNSLLPLMIRYGTNATTWEGSGIRTFCLERILPAISYRWKSVIKPVKVLTASGAYSSKSFVTTLDSIYIPAFRDVAEPTGTNSQYSGEATSPTALFSQQATPSGQTISLPRFRWAGVIIESRDFSNLTPGRRFFTGDDPIASGQACDDGDVWYDSSRSPYFYVYFSAETLSKHSMIGSVMSWSSSDLYGWIPTINGGAWVRSESWWTRSPNESTTGNFMMKQTSPQYTSTNLTSASQTNYAGILVCVSI